MPDDPRNAVSASSLSDFINACHYFSLLEEALNHDILPAISGLLV